MFLKIKAFTLIELLVVIVVISILLVIAVPTYQNFIRKGRRSEGLSALLALQLAEEKYRFNNVSYGTLAQAWSGSRSSAPAPSVARRTRTPPRSP